MIYLQGYDMNNFERLIERACGFTVLMLLLIYLLGAFAGIEDNGIELGSFALILLFGFIIAIANLVIGYNKIAVWLRICLHYSVLLLAFCAVFIGSGRITNNTQGSYFAAVVIFTFLYALIALITFLSKKLVKRTDKAIAKRADKKTAEENEEAPKKYTKRYE